MIKESKEGGVRDELRDTSKLCGAIFISTIIRGFCSTGSSREIYSGVCRFVRFEGDGI
jgi:hypothetical protein